MYSGENIILKQLRLIFGTAETQTLPFAGIQGLCVCVTDMEKLFDLDLIVNKVAFKFET